MAEYELAGRNLDWALKQLELATEVADNPGGGKLSAIQAVGQVRAYFEELDSSEEYKTIVKQLYQAERAFFYNQFDTGKQLINSVIAQVEGKHKVESA